MTSVWAHRGASAAEPENTPSAFAAAVAMGADGIELDVRCTGDGALVVHHDAHLPDGRALAHLPIGELPGHVPTLATALDACGHLLVNIEMKDLPGEPGHDERRSLADRLVAFLAAAGGGGADGDRRVIVSSFDLAALDRVRELDDTVATGYLTMVSAGGELAPRLVDRCRRHGLGALHPHHLGVDPALVSRCRDAGIALHAWTVDDPARIAELAALGVDAVITNRPDVALKALGR